MPSWVPARSSQPSACTVRETTPPSSRVSSSCRHTMSAPTIWRRAVGGEQGALMVTVSVVNCRHKKGCPRVLEKGLKTNECTPLVSPSVERSAQETLLSGLLCVGVCEQASRFATPRIYSAKGTRSGLSRRRRDESWHDARYDRGINTTFWPLYT